LVNKDYDKCFVFKKLGVTFIVLAAMLNQYLNMKVKTPASFIIANSLTLD